MNITEITADMPKAEVAPHPEFLCCNEGYVFYRDGRLSPQTAHLYDESGKLLAIIPGVRSIHLAPLPR